MKRGADVIGSVIIDGGNMAKEGREGLPPTWEHLRSGIEAARQRWPDAQIGVLLDHTIAAQMPDKDEFDRQAGSYGATITPTGVVGKRHDELLLERADELNAIVISNDKFQPFVKEFPWLREEPGRLYGPKFVLGWMFVERVGGNAPSLRNIMRLGKAAGRKVAGKATKANKRSADQSATDPVQTQPPTPQVRRPERRKIRAVPRNRQQTAALARFNESLSARASGFSSVRGLILAALEEPEIAAVFDHPGVVLNAVGTWVSTVGLTHSGSLAAVFNDPSTVAGTGLEVLDELRSGGLLLRTRRPLATRLADFAAQVTPGTDPARWIADWIVQEPETVTVAANGVGLDLAGLRPVIAHARARYPDAFGNVSELTPGLTAEFATRRGASLDGHVVHLAAPLLSEPAASTGRPDPSTPPSSPEATALALATRPTSDGWSPPVSASSDPTLRHALLADVTERVVGWGDLTDEEFWSRVAADEGVRAVSVGGRTVPFTLIADWARQCGLTAPIERGGFIEWLHESNIEDFGLRLLTSAAGAGVTLAVPPAPDDAWMADAGSAYRQFILARWPDGTSEDVDPIRVLVEFLYAWPAADGPLARGVDIKQLVSHLAGQLPVQTRHLARLPEHLSQTSRQTQYRRSVSGLRGMVYANGLYSLIDAPEVGVRQAEVAGGEALAVAVASGNRTRVLAGGNDLPWLPPIAADAQREFLEPMTPS